MTSFFNKDKVYPEVWCSGLIKPTIYKKGDRKILATAEETFSHGQIILIVDDRLSLWLTFQCQIKWDPVSFQNEHAERLQMPSSSCIRPCNHSRRKRNQFAKAFDWVSHSLLWKSLSSLGLSRNITCISRPLLESPPTTNYIYNPIQYCTGVRRDVTSIHFSSIFT